MDTNQTISLLGVWVQYPLWLLLLIFTVAEHHRRCKQIREEVVALGYNPQLYFVFLLNVAQFEFLLKEVQLPILSNICRCKYLTPHTHPCTNTHTHTHRSSRSFLMRNRPNGKPIKRRGQNGWQNLERFSLVQNLSLEWRRMVSISQTFLLLRCGKYN